MEKLDGKSLDIVAQNIEKLREIFPDVFTEGKVDFEALEAVLGEYIDRDDERYSFTWKGKSRARRIAQTPSTGTLRPAPEESKNWDTTQNLYIEGDNLEVLKLLQKSYHKQVKMIYIDPPYNTGKDFVYKDDFKDNIKNYLEVTGQVDFDGNKISTNSDTNGRYHSDWLNMMYPRLKLARNLLREDGVIFISIDDNEMNNLHKLCDEIFGERNFIASFPRVTKKAGKSSEQVAKNNDYIYCYQKTDKLSLNEFEHNDSGFKYKDEYVEERGFFKLNQTLDYNTLGYVKSLDYPIEIDDKIFYAGNISKSEYEIRQKENPKDGFRWRWSKELFNFGKENGFIVVKEYDTYSRIYTKTYQKATISKNNDGYFVELKKRTKPITTLDLVENKYSNDNSKKDLFRLFQKNIFEYSKPIELIKTLSYIGSNDNDIILDFFSGSGTTAQAVLELNSEDNKNRKFIMVQLPEEIEQKSEAYKAGYSNICEIGKERIRRAGDKIMEKGKRKKENFDVGFKVFKLDSSNIKTWDPDYENLEESLLDSVDNIKEDRTEADILYEILLKYGLDLTLPIEELELASKRVYVVGLGSLIICLDEQITLDVVEEIAKLKEKYASGDLMRVVFRDNSFKDTEVKINAVQILEQSGIDDIRSL